VRNNASIFSLAGRRSHPFVRSPVHSGASPLTPKHQPPPRPRRRGAHPMDQVRSNVSAWPQCVHQMLSPATFCAWGFPFNTKRFKDPPRGRGVKRVIVPKGVR
jgi:hypothetical protein